MTTTELKCDVPVLSSSQTISRSSKESSQPRCIVQEQGHGLEGHGKEAAGIITPSPRDIKEQDGRASW